MWCSSVFSVRLIVNPKHQSLSLCACACACVHSSLYGAEWLIHGFGHFLTYVEDLNQLNVWLKKKKKKNFLVVFCQWLLELLWKTTFHLCNMSKLMASWINKYKMAASSDRQGLGTPLTHALEQLVLPCVWTEFTNNEIKQRVHYVAIVLFSLKNEKKKQRQHRRVFVAAILHKFVNVAQFQCSTSTYTDHQPQNSLCRWVLKRVKSFYWHNRKSGKRDKEWLSTKGPSIVDLVVHSLH